MLALYYVLIEIASNMYMSISIIDKKQLGNIISIYKSTTKLKFSATIPILVIYSVQEEYA